MRKLATAAAEPAALLASGAAVRASGPVYGPDAAVRASGRSVSDLGSGRAFGRDRHRGRSQVMGGRAVRGRTSRAAPSATTSGRVATIAVKSCTLMTGLLAAERQRVRDFSAKGTAANLVPRPRLASRQSGGSMSGRGPASRLVGRGAITPVRHEIIISSISLLGGDAPCPSTGLATVSPALAIMRAASTLATGPTTKRVSTPIRHSLPAAIRRSLACRGASANLMTAQGVVFIAGPVGPISPCPGLAKILKMAVRLLGPNASLSLQVLRQGEATKGVSLVMYGVQRRAATKRRLAAVIMYGAHHDRDGAASNVR